MRDTHADARGPAPPGPCSEPVTSPLGCLNVIAEVSGVQRLMALPFCAHQENDVERLSWNPLKFSRFGVSPPRIPIPRCPEESVSPESCLWVAPAEKTPLSLGPAEGTGVCCTSARLAGSLRTERVFQGRLHSLVGKETRRLSGSCWVRSVPRPPELHAVLHQASSRVHFSCSFLFGE